MNSCTFWLMMTGVNRCERAIRTHCSKVREAPLSLPMNTHASSTPTMPSRPRTAVPAPMTTIRNVHWRMRAVMESSWPSGMSERSPALMRVRFWLIVNGLVSLSVPKIRRSPWFAFRFMLIVENTSRVLEGNPMDSAVFPALMVFATAWAATSRARPTQRAPCLTP